MKTQRVIAALLVSAGIAVASGCAQEVGDIDRTDPNRIDKADFADGAQWHFRQTIADVPHTNPFFFTGLSTSAEKLTFEITQGSLLGYRSYELVPGADPSASTNDINDTTVIEGRGEGINPDVYKGSPVLAYLINSHFDVQRQYSAATGEQNNVIVENTDKYWDDRQYMHVNWAANLISSIFLFDTDNLIQYQYWQGEEHDTPTVKFERSEDGTLEYFEFTTKALIQPSFACFFYYEGDCGPTEVKIVNSFVRVAEKETYEMVEYGNDDMAKFGYFRTERVTYDRRRGLRRTGELFLPNRHNIWETSYDESGNLIPIKDRTPKAIAYHLNKEMPEDLWDYNQGMADEWDRAFRRAVAAAKGMTPEAVETQFGALFVVCHNPVTADDHAECGETGLEVGVGDLRYNHFYWGDDPQLSGPLGYGPSAADPETGEIISGTAYVYGASVDRYASSALDIINVALACETEFVDNEGVQVERIKDEIACNNSVKTIQGGSDITMEVARRINPGIDPRVTLGKVSPEMRLTKLPENAMDVFSPEQRIAYERFQADPQPYDPGFEARQVEKIRDNNFDLMMLSEGDILSMTNGQYKDLYEMPEEMREEMRPANWMTATRIHRQSEERINHFAKNNVLHEDFFDDVAIGLALSLVDEAKALGLSADAYEDYMYKRLRGLIYKAVMEHEVGHTIGLRHNFQGSYDSLNYFDNYWKLRQESITTSRTWKEELNGGAENEQENYDDWSAAGKPVMWSLTDIYEIVAETPNQRKGRVVNEDGSIEQLSSGMREYQYSSIMDYGFQFNTDFQGVGRYDEAAIIYAYTTGYDGKMDEDGFPTAESGFVEVFADEAFTDAKVSIAGLDLQARIDLVGNGDNTTLAADHPKAGDALAAGGRRQVADLIRTYDDNTSPAFDKLLESYHYLDIADRFGNVANLSKRNLMRYDAIKTEIAKRDRWADEYSEGINPLTATERCAQDPACQDRPVEVPYMFCTDDWVGVDSSCHRWDLGADPYEQATLVTKKYREYYMFNNFARDSLYFNPSGLIGRTFTRSLYYLSNIYQGVFTSRTANNQAFFYRWLAAHVGLNMVTEILTMPNHGEYTIPKARVTAGLERLGDDCVNGGLRIVAGVDVDNDGDIVADEINSVSYACSSEDAETENNGTCEGEGCALAISRTLEKGEEDCIQGGIEVTSGVDINGDEELSEDEYDSSIVTCHANMTVQCGWEVGCNDEDVDASIAKGEGRYPYSRYDYDRGYGYYRYPTEAGHFYDYLAAILAMTNTQATVRGVDVDTDVLAYSIPFHLLFDSEVDTLFNSLWLQKPEKHGPVLYTDEDGVNRFYHRPLAGVQFVQGLTQNPETGEEIGDENVPVGMEDDLVTRPFVSYGNRFYALLYGMAFFSSNLDLSFADNNKVFRLGAGEQIEPGEGFRLVTCEDPVDGVTYGTITNAGSNKKTAAEEIVERCDAFADEYRIARARLDSERQGELAQELDSVIGYMNLMRSFYDTFGNL